MSISLTDGKRLAEKYLCKRKCAEWEFQLAQEIDAAISHAKIPTKEQPVGCRERFEKWWETLSAKEVRHKDIWKLCYRAYQLGAEVPMRESGNPLQNSLTGIYSWDKKANELRFIAPSLEQVWEQKP